MSKESHQLAVVAPEKIQALDEFATKNNLAVLTEGKGAFTAALATAEAIGRLREMLTPDVIAPIMNLQGIPLGFRTDKEKSGGYEAPVVRDVMIEMTIRGGFKLYGNEVNIIAGRGYITKEGFQNWFRRMAAEGKCGPVDVKLGVPKTAGDGAVILACASVKWGNLDVTTGQSEIAVRGNGADLQLGKATRKILARLFEKVTGVQVADGDALDVTTTPVPETKTEAPVGGNVATVTDEQKQILKEELKGHEDAANTWLRANKAIPATGTFLDVKPMMAARIIGDPARFIAAIKGD